MIRLNGWQRIGIVLAMLWFITVLTKLAADVSGGNVRQSPFYSITPHSGGGCEIVLPPVQNKARYTTEELICPKDRVIPYSPERIEFSIMKLMGILLIPPFALYALVALVSKTIRWVVQGFKNNS